LRGYQGGVLWVNNPDMSATVAEVCAGLPEPPPHPWKDQFKQLAISLLSQPRAWSMVRGLSFLGVGAEDQDFDRRPTRLAGWQAALAAISLQRVDQYNAVRSHLAERITVALAGIEGITFQTPVEGNDSTCLRLALRLEGTQRDRDRLVARLQAAGVDARAFYSRVIYDYPWWQADERQEHCPAAEMLLSTHFTLPLYYAMEETQVRQMADLIGGCCNGR
jgi:hypothetical protein